MAQVKSYRCAVVDVFTTEPLAGNPLAVYQTRQNSTKRRCRRSPGSSTWLKPPLCFKQHAKIALHVLILYASKRVGIWRASHNWHCVCAVARRNYLAKSSEFSWEVEVGPIPIRIEGGQHPLIWFGMPPIREGKCYGSSLRESSGAGTAGPVANPSERVSPQ